ncbi:MAG: hypothetical protein V4549_07395 [Bacteroidota bacterium]
MATSLYKIAEMCRQLTEKRVSIQVLVDEVGDAYGSVAKKIWYENTSFDEQSIDGSFLNTFSNLQPECDCDRDAWFITIPSTYLILPHQMGVNWVSLMKDKKSYVLVNNWGIYEGLKSSVMGGRGVYLIEGNKMWFPIMTKETCGPVLLKLAIAYDDIDPYEPLNIGPNIVNDIVSMVVAPYMNKQNPIEKVREIIN